MAAGITSHVLNITTGLPFPDVRIELYDLSDGAPKRIKEVTTNSDGRALMLAPEEARAGAFEMRFHVGERFKVPDALTDVVPVRFNIADKAEHYHVPMLCAPWFFSTYRGS